MVRFSEITLSSSNFPNLKLSQGLLRMLSNLTHADSKWKAPVLSDEGTSRNEMLLYRVPAVRMSRPERSKPCELISRSAVFCPANVSTRTLLALSPCQLGTIRNVAGQYAGFCQMGESRSFMSWYPLSLNVCPKTLSFGQASWQAEQGSPYFRANAGMATALFTDPRKAIASNTKAAKLRREQRAMRSSTVLLPSFYFRAQSCVGDRRYNWTRTSPHEVRADAPNITSRSTSSSEVLEVRVRRAIDAYERCHVEVRQRVKDPLRLRVPG